MRDRLHGDGRGQAQETNEGDGHAEEAELAILVLAAELVADDDLKGVMDALREQADGGEEDAALKQRPGAG